MHEKSDDPIRLFVVHWNRPAECAATVRALIEQRFDLSVVVIDNGSSSEALDCLRSSLGPAVEIMPLGENRGWGPALNVALQPWLDSDPNRYSFISAHDAQAHTNCLALLLAAMDRDPRIGIACPQYADRSVARLSAIHGISQAIAEPRPVGTAQEVDVPHGTLMLIRRECLAEIGLFDERYFAYGDEHELGARARRACWKVVMVWGAIVANPETSTSSAWRSYLFTRNSLLFVHDYFGTVFAWLRLLLVLLNTVRLATTKRDDDFAFSVRARWQGCRDYVLGRFGQPPA